MNKDIYLYTLQFTDDDTIINMLSVNKQFHQEEYFKKMVEKRYSLFIKCFKEYNENWKKLFIRISHFVKKLNDRIEMLDEEAVSRYFKSSLISNNLISFL